MLAYGAWLGPCMLYFFVIVRVILGRCESFTNNSHQNKTKRQSSRGHCESRLLQFCAFASFVSEAIRCFTRSDSLLQFEALRSFTRSHLRGEETVRSHAHKNNDASRSQAHRDRAQSCSQTSESQVGVTRQRLIANGRGRGQTSRSIEMAFMMAR